MSFRDLKNGFGGLKTGAGWVWKNAVSCSKIMVDLVGIEPTTSSMPWKRAPSCATGPRVISFSPTLVGFVNSSVRI